MVCWSSRKNVRWPFKMFSSSVSKATISVTKDFRLIRTGIAMISWQIVGQSSLCRRPTSLRPSAVWWMSQRRPSPPQACALSLLPPPRPPKRSWLTARNPWACHQPKPTDPDCSSRARALNCAARPLRPAQGGLALPASPSSFPSCYPGLAFTAPPLSSVFFPGKLG